MSATEVRASPPAYEMFEIDIIGFAPNADTIGRFGINNRGEIAYTQRVGLQYRAMIYLPCAAYGLGPGVHDLTDPQVFPFGSQLTGDSYARDINDHGVVVGQFGGIERGEGRAFAVDLAGTMGLGDNIAVWPPIGGDPPSDGCSDWGRAVAVTGGLNNPQVVIERPLSRVCLAGSCELTAVEECASTGALWSHLAGPGPALITSFPLVECPVGSADLPSTFAHDAEIYEGSSGVLALAGHAEHYVYLQELLENGCFQAQGGCWENYVPLRWSQSGFTSLDRPTPEFSAWARGINVDGHAVGYARVQFGTGMGNCRLRAMIWPAGSSSPTNIHPAVDDFAARSRAESINRRSLNVGVVGWNPQLAQALLWTQQGPSFGSWNGWELQTGQFESTASYRTVIDCPDPSLDCSSSTPNVTLNQAFDINDYGWIIAWGIKQGESDGNQFRLYLLIPVDGDVCGRSGDINQDGEIDLADLLLLLNAWGSCSCATLCPADLNGDGEVNNSDLWVLLSHWGSCAGESMGLPQSVSDCINRVGLDPVVLSACISAIE